MIQWSVVSGQWSVVSGRGRWSVNQLPNFDFEIAGPIDAIFNSNPTADD